METQGDTEEAMNWFETAFADGLQPKAGVHLKRTLEFDPASDITHDMRRRLNAISY